LRRAVQRERDLRSSVGPVVGTQNAQQSSTPGSSPAPRPRRPLWPWIAALTAATIIWNQKWTGSTQAPIVQSVPDAQSLRPASQLLSPVRPFLPSLAVAAVAANLRSEGKARAKIVAQLQRGTLLETLGEGGASRTCGWWMGGTAGLLPT